MPRGCLTAEAKLRYGHTSSEQTMRRSNYREEEKQPSNRARFLISNGRLRVGGRRTKETGKRCSGLTHGSLDPKEKISPSAGVSTHRDDRQVSQQCSACPSTADPALRQQPWPVQHCVGTLYGISIHLVPWKGWALWALRALSCPFLGAVPHVEAALCHGVQVMGTALMGSGSTVTSCFLPVLRKYWEENEAPGWLQSLLSL